MSDFVQTLVPALGNALVQFTWQGLVIGAVAAVALRLARAAQPQVRYAIACLAMLACVLVPLLGVVLQFGDSVATDIAVTDGMPVRVVDDGIAMASRFEWHARLDALLPRIVALWAAGASVLCLRTLLGIAWVRRMRALPQPPLQARWQATLDALALRFGCEGVSLRLVDALESPVAAGWWRPVVLLPLSVAMRLPAPYVEALLAHELAHVRRHDYLVNLLQRAVEALLFFHPVTWWLSRRVRIERELIADRLAADAIGDAHRLARALAALSDPMPRSPALPHVAHAAHGGHLMSRIQHLVRSVPRDRQPAGRIALPMLGIAAACIAFYAQAQIGQPDATPAPVVATTPAPAPRAATASVDAKPVVAARSATQVAQVARVRTGSKSDRDAWAIVRKGEDGYSMSGSNRDMDQIEVAKRSLQGDFVWFRRDGKAWVIDDPSILARVTAAWKDSDALGERMSALGEQMEVHGKKMEALGAQMEQLGAGRAPSPAMQEAQEQMGAMAERQQDLAGRQQLIAMKQRKAEGAERERLDREMQALSEEMHTLGEQMRTRGEIVRREAEHLHENAEPMEALGARMHEAAKPMDALGEQMGELGRQQEQLVRKAEQDLDALIAEAMRKGLAKPAPKAR